MSISKNPILKGVQPVDITDAFKKAAGEATYRRVLKIVQSVKYKNTVLYGGALRDIFIGTCGLKDYDFAIDPTHKMPKVSDSGGSSITVDRQTIPIDYSIRNPKIEFGSNVSDLTKLRVLRADAPINAIAMGTDGKVWAHPDFIDHATKGIYEIRKDMSNINKQHSFDRYQRFKEDTYPNWVLKI